jgi:hypothetical protein
MDFQVLFRPSKKIGRSDVATVHANSRLSSHREVPHSWNKTIYPEKYRVYTGLLQTGGVEGTQRPPLTLIKVQIGYSFSRPKYV